MIVYRSIELYVFLIHHHRQPIRILYIKFVYSFLIVEKVKNLLVSRMERCSSIRFIFQSVGKRDVDCSILSYKPLEQTPAEERVSTLRHRSNTATTTTTTTTTGNATSISPQETREWSTDSNPSDFRLLLLGDPLLTIVLSVLGVICAVVLVLPTIPDNDHSLHSRIPSYLHMTTNAKIIASYILGKSVLFFYFWVMRILILGLLTVVFIRR